MYIVQVPSNEMKQVMELFLYFKHSAPSSDFFGNLVHVVRHFSSSKTVQDAIVGTSAYIAADFGNI